jgi:hypothetical protein
MRKIEPYKEFGESKSQDHVPFSFKKRQLSIILEEDTLGHGKIEQIEEGKKPECSPTSSSSLQIINRAKMAIAEAKQQRLKTSNRVKLFADPQRDESTQVHSTLGKSVLKRYIESRVQPKLECPVEKENPEGEPRPNHKHNKKGNTVPSTTSCYYDETAHRSEEELKEFVGRLRREYQLTMMHSKNNDPKAMKALHDFFHLCDRIFQKEKIRGNNLLR